ncbi:TIGR03756 family integrating conjugative element protein [Niveibacterium sp. 24ML]|uniref:TIGR03756 family integrating conjugative element protein n=1 Tax=Niveibacterium sp. 24ML TaxID=2985512 RepID=UPI00226E1324|nr:TIGR03756 family integrating conjugative element protein [Niveibacterium sp. 24ML]MCX9158157.1 TIGR03756 family integrating conjugative element protein [Niveibacterium sp. 24ML]
MSALTRALALLSLSGALALLSPHAQGQTTTTELMSASISGMSSCTKWTPVGACFWIKCALFKCSVKTSVKVRHYAPDLAVSTFHNVKDHPWKDYGRTVEEGAMSVAEKLVGSLDTAGTRSRETRVDKNTRFRDADAIGHPSAASNGWLSSLPILCPQPAVQAFRPYMLTPLDGLAWRNFVGLEALNFASWIPGLREVGNWPTNTWGNLYPRTGWLVQQHDVKNSALLAQRVGDIVTRSGQAHVYTAVGKNSTTTSNNKRVWLPPELEERKGSTGMWQMQYPKVGSCVVFGDNDAVNLSAFGDNKTSAESGYVWALWRPYRCCQKSGQIFIGSFGD